MFHSIFEISLTKNTVRPQIFILIQPVIQKFLTTLVTFKLVVKPYHCQINLQPQLWDFRFLKILTHVNYSLSHIDALHDSQGLYIDLSNYLFGAHACFPGSINSEKLTDQHTIFLGLGSSIRGYISMRASIIFMFLGVWLASRRSARAIEQLTPSASSLLLKG